jgi:hypothetical protein
MEYGIGACCWAAQGMDKRSEMGHNAAGEMAMAPGSFYSVGATTRRVGGGD